MQTLKKSTVVYKPIACCEYVFTTGDRALSYCGVADGVITVGSSRRATIYIANDSAFTLQLKSTCWILGKAYTLDLAPSARAVFRKRNWGWQQI